MYKIFNKMNENKMSDLTRFYVKRMVWKFTPQVYVQCRHNNKYTLRLYRIVFIVTFTSFSPQQRHLLSKSKVGTHFLDKNSWKKLQLLLTHSKADKADVFTRDCSLKRCGTNPPWDGILYVQEVVTHFI